MRDRETRSSGARGRAASTIVGRHANLKDQEPGPVLRRVTRFTPFLLLAAALVSSGCLGGGGDGDDGAATGTGIPLDPLEAVRAALAGVPCEAPVGEGTSANLLLLANASSEGGGAGDIDIGDDILASTSALFDISDPLHPTVLADFDLLEISGGGDVKFLHGNQSIVMGGGGVVLVDIRDPTAPVVEDEWSFDEFTGVNLPGGDLFLNAHMLATARIGEQDWVFVAPNSNSGVWILAVEGEVGSRQLVYVTQTLPVEGGPLGPHDMSVTQDEFTGEWLLYSADGFHGWTVFNIDDPTQPLPVGGLVAPQTGYTHTIQAARIGERRIVATIQEVGENILSIYDATILQAPVLLATWQVQAGATTPQHNLNIVDGRLYVAHYGYGMYVFDLLDAGALPLVGAASLQPVAHYDPVPGGEPFVAGIGGFEAIYDVVLKDGVLYLSGFSDPVVGVFSVGYGCLTPGDSEQTSTN